MTYGEFRGGEVFSVRVDTETARELRWAAKESGHGISALFRRGLNPILAVIRADWYEKHGSEDDWEIVAAEAGERKELKSSFGVALTGAQVIEIGQAAEACGVTISAYLREAGLALAAAQQAGGMVRCPHFSMGPVTSADCPACGPLRPSLQVLAPAKK